VVGTAEKEAVRATTVKWLSRNVLAIGMLSLCSDMGHELTTSVLPLFLATFGGGAIALGTIEGVSDAASSLVKMWTSYESDRVGKRKPILAVGSLVTALMGCFAFVTSWWQLVAVRAIGWIGRGARGPLRDALLSESVTREAHGRAFGFESAMDTLGAIIGPVIALSLIGVISLRHIFLVSFIPGFAAFFIAVFWIKEVHRKPQPHLRMWASVKALPMSFWRYALPVGVFGLGNFAHTLLVLRAVTLLEPIYGSATAGRIGVGLYILHNVIYAAISYPIGALGDRRGKRSLLMLGYLLFGALCLLLLVHSHPLVVLVCIFVLAGMYIGIVDSMERAIAADIIPLKQRGAGFGALATINSIGDLVSSILVGFLWARFSIGAGALYAAALTISGGILLWLCSPRHKDRRDILLMQEIFS
jgi:MFS family permease